MTSKKARKPARARRRGNRGTRVTIAYGQDFVNQTSRKVSLHANRSQASAPSTPAATQITMPQPRVVRASEKSEELLATWKRTHQAAKVAEFQNTLARSAVKADMDAQRADCFVSTLGTIPIQMRGGTPTVDYQAMARENIPPKQFAKLLARYTTLTPITPTLAAPSGWSAELGLPKID